MLKGLIFLSSSYHDILILRGRGGGGDGGDGGDGGAGGLSGRERDEGKGGGGNEGEGREGGIRGVGKGGDERRRSRGLR